MTRFAPIAAVGALLAVGVAAALLLAPAGEPTDGERADVLARELRCPDCQGLSVADSPTQSGVEIRRQIDELLASGASPDDVRAHFVGRYGEWILLAPSSPLPWLIPFIVLGLAAVVLVAWLVRARADPEERSVPVSPGARRSIHDEADALDA